MKTNIYVYGHDKKVDSETHDNETDEPWLGIFHDHELMTTLIW